MTPRNRELLGRPIERTSIAEQVARRIMSLIQTGAVLPGDRLPAERELASSLGVGRASVREAVRALSVLGMLEARQGGGMFVIRPDMDTSPLRFFIGSGVSGLEKLYEARISIEQSIGKLAATRIRKETLSRLNGLLKPQRELVKHPVGFRVSDGEFHDIIWKSADNPVLERVSRGLHALGLERRPIARETPAVLKRSCADHEKIVSALSARDPAAAAEALAAHMRNVLKSTRVKGKNYEPPRGN